MKRMVWMSVVALIVMTLAGSPVWAQCPKQAACDLDSALEQLILLQLAKDVGLDSYDLMDLLDGQAQFHEMMTDLAAQEAELKAELKAAIAADDASAIEEAMDALLSLQEDKQDSLHQGLQEAGTLLGAKGQGKLCLIMLDLEGAKKCLKKKLAACNKPCCAQKQAASCGQQQAASCAKSGGAAPAVAVVVDPNVAIMETVNGWFAGLVAEDVEATMKLVSEDFEHYEYGDKEGLTDFLEQANDMGYLEDLEIDKEDAEVEIEDGEAVVYPIEMSGYFGTITFELILEEEEGAWMVTGMDASGI
jgi:hypothetical protein